jgi:hypothetical protein
MNGTAIGTLSRLAKEATDRPVDRSFDGFCNWEGGFAACLSVRFAPERTSAPLRPGVGHPVAPAGILPRRRQDLPSSWGTSVVRLHMFHSDADGTADTRPIQCRGVAPGHRKAKAPMKGLSTLDSMAFGLAVYASPDSLPHHDARLASGRWSGATGRAFHPQGSAERFQVSFLHPILPSQASWRNRCDRSGLASGPVTIDSLGGCRPAVTSPQHWVGRSRVHSESSYQNSSVSSDGTAGHQSPIGRANCLGAWDG